MWDIGVNTWVWTSPLTDEGLAALAPKVREWGFDVIELPVEQPGDWDPRRAADLLAELNLGATVCLVMPSGRELVAADTVAETQDYLRRVVDVAAIVGSPVAAGPAYSSVGRTWRIDDRPRVYRELRHVSRAEPVPVLPCERAGIPRDPRAGARRPVAGVRDVASPAGEP